MEIDPIMTKSFRLRAQKTCTYRLKINKLEVTFPCDPSGVLEDVGGAAILHTLPGQFRINNVPFRIICYLMRIG